VAVALNVVITCNHARCTKGVRVRVITYTASTIKVARAAVAAFGWVVRVTPGGKGKGRFGKESDYCPECASKHPAPAAENQGAPRARKVAARS
jgi:hypothetical protein